MKNHKFCGKYSPQKTMLALILAVSCISTLVADEYTKNILVLNPFTEIGDWGMDFNIGLFENLKNLDRYSVSYFHQFMGAEISPEIMNESILDQYLNLNKLYKIDAIIGIFTPAQNFMLEKGSEFFRDIPKIFVPTLEAMVPAISDAPNSYYILSGSGTGIETTLLDMQQMLPDLERIYVYSGDGESDTPYLNLFQQITGELKLTKEIHYKTGLSKEAILSDIKMLPDNSAIFMLTINRASNGEIIIMTDLFPAITNVASAPIFTFHEDYLGTGIVGGCLTSGKTYGTLTGTILSNIFTGNETMLHKNYLAAIRKYDWTALNRWGIKESDVPENAQILFKKQGFLEQYKYPIIGALFIILFEGGTIILLISALKKNIRIFDELQENKNKISASLNEKALLLKEIHHRVKNNLTLIRSFLSLQLDYVEDTRLTEILEKIQNRIYSMSLVHEHLYQVENLKTINVKNYIEDLVSSLVAGFSNHQDPIRTDLQIDDIELELDQLIPIGLIINEILSNSLKYAFEGIENPKLSIKIVELSENSIQFQIYDNGTGLPEAKELEHKKSFGLMIVSALIEQLHSNLHITRENGTRYEFTLLMSE